MVGVAGRQSPAATHAKPKRAADYKVTSVAAIDAPVLPLVSAPWASMAAPRLDAAPDRPSFQARQANRPSNRSKPRPVASGSGDVRKLSAVRIQAVYRGYQVRRHVSSFKNSAQAYSSKLSRAKKGTPVAPPQLPGALYSTTHTKSERIRSWADNAARHPFDALSPERPIGAVDTSSSPVKHYNDGLERHEAKEERRERRRQRALNNPPPPLPDNDDTMSVSSIGSQSQDPRTWISSRSSRRQRRKARKSKSSSGSRVPAADFGVPSHSHYGNTAGSVMNPYKIPLAHQMAASDTAARAQLNPYGGGTPGGAYSMPHHNPFMPPVTKGLSPGHHSHAQGSPPQMSIGHSATGGEMFSSPPNYGGGANGPVHDIMRDLNDLASMRTTAAGQSQVQAQAQTTFPSGMGPGFGGQRMSYPPDLGGGLAGGFLSGGYVAPGGASAWAGTGRGGMSPIVENQTMHRPHQSHLNVSNVQTLQSQLYTGHGSNGGVAASASGGDDTASVAGSSTTAVSMAAEAEERLSRIENMLEKLTRAER